MIAVFADWCRAKRINLHRGQRVIAEAIVRSAATDPDPQKFLFSIGAGRKFLMLKLNLFFGDLAGQDMRWAERNPLG